MSNAGVQGSHVGPKRAWVSGRAGTWAVVTLLALGLPFPASAQGLPGALKEVRRNDGMCRREEAGAPQGGGQPGAAQPEADLGCAVASQVAVHWLGAEDALFVDTRRLPEHAQSGIPGAVHLGVADLLGKPYLKSRRVVLFGSGKADEMLYRQCTRLKQQGFARVHVVRGGISAWQASGQKIAGSAGGVDTNLHVNPAEAIMEAEFNGNVVLVVAKRSQAQRLMPASVLVPSASLSDIRSALERRSKEVKGAPFASVLLIADGETSEGLLRQIQQGLLPVPLLAYTGTDEALNAQHARQRAIWAERDRGPIMPGCGL